MAGQAHTQFAMQAIDFAGIFNAVAGSQPIAATEGDAFKAELSAPEGPSTGGGKQSVQHIKLSRPGLTVVAGQADTVERSGELRSYDYVSALHAQRFHGAALPIARTEYDEFIKRAKGVLAQQQLSIVMKDAAPGSAAPQPQSGGSSIGYVIIGLVIALAVGGAAYFFVMK
jgi:hypothetical protein